MQVAGAALLVSSGSAVMFPASFIYFGVLHFVAVALLLGLLTAKYKVWNCALGVAVFVAIRLANRAAVSSFTHFTDTLTGQSDLIVQAPASPIAAATKS